MRVTLITATFNDLVHGTFNDKKTGCGINLLKPETASRYHKNGEMKYLGELTCEKCKAKIAKEMIKADSKEMKALLKEEKQRAKMGLDDEGLVQLSEYEVKPTAARPAEPEPEPEPAYTPPPVNTSNVQVNTNNPAFSDDLAQFAIKKPEPEPEPPKEESVDDFLAQFAINKPAPEPEPPKEESVDDFLAQFAINKPAPEPEPEPEESVDDFLAQFAAPKPEPEPVQEESVDDFLAQFSTPAPEPEPEPEESVDDFLAQFAAPKPEPEYKAPEPKSPPVLDDISSVLEAMQNKPFAPAKEEPVYEETVVEEPIYEEAEDDILSMFSVGNSEDADDDDETLFDTMNADKNEKSDNVSEWDVIANQLFGEDSEDAQAENAQADDISVPEIEDIVAPPVKEKVAEPKPAVAPPPVAPPPVQIPNMTPPPVMAQPMMAPNMQPMNAQGAIGQIVTMPQITGYGENGQPIYSYVQMIIQGYDPNGQPILMPFVPQGMMGMQMPAMAAPPVAPVAPAQPAPQAQSDFAAYTKNTRLQDALNAAMETPVSEKEMTIGQKIAAANAAKPVSANVSKIATNEHSKSTSQAFINAISESKDAKQSLTETQGLQPKTAVLDSIEDVLSQFGDNSFKEKKAAEAAKANQAVPKYEEFKTPSKSAYTPSSSFSRPVPSSSRNSYGMDDLPLSKAQQKERKKEEKEAAKFRKQMEKRKK